MIKLIVDRRECLVDLGNMVAPNGQRLSLSSYISIFFFFFSLFFFFFFFFFSFKTNKKNKSEYFNRLKNMGKYIFQQRNKERYQSSQTSR